VIKKQDNFYSVFNMIWIVHRNVYLHFSRSELLMLKIRAKTPPTRPGNRIDVFMGSIKTSALQKNLINGFQAKEK